MKKVQTSLSKAEPLFPHAPMEKCGLSGCPTTPTTRFSIRKKGVFGPMPFVDMCDMHVNEAIKNAKEGSYHTCPLSIINEDRKKMG